MHGYKHIKIKNIYRLKLDDCDSLYDDSVGNVQEVYHGSSEANILSILRSGLQISPPSTAKIAGKMFGNGVYGSQTASKSLGYSAGRWGQSSSKTAWLFVCDFAMGNTFYPTTYGLSKIPACYNSCWALPEKTGLHNDELIVYKSNQVKIKYLLECN
jgi:poly [ADP-ribose] polymerase